jgi:hypothetical protein
MRNIPMEFSIKREFIFIALILFLKIFVGLLTYRFFFHSELTEKEILLDDYGLSIFAKSRDLYFQNFLILLIMVQTGIINWSLTYKPSNIVPFPASEEVIYNFDLALTFPISMQYFYNFLEQQDYYKEALIIFSLHGDIRKYL